MVIIKSLLDTDFYKFSMAQCVLHHFPDAEAEYELIVRSDAKLGHMLGHISDDVSALCSLKFTTDELNYLRGIRFLKNDFVDFLEDFQLKIRHFRPSVGEDGQLRIRIVGPWIQTILFEVPILAIISERYGMDREMNVAFEAGRRRFLEKIGYIRSIPGPFRFADFGTRRRFSALWHDQIVEELVADSDGRFVGTSNVYLAKKYGVKAIGTMAHEFIQAGQGLDNVRLSQSQKYMLEAWAREYRGDLGIALTDTIGMDAFLRDFDLYLAKLYDGCRHDSGDPYVWCDKLIGHYRSLGIEPLTKTAVFSDGLRFEDAAKIFDRFRGSIKISFGIGTHLTNDMGGKPLSIVMKLVRLNGKPVAKISDAPGKVVCEDPGFLVYLKDVFKVGGEL